MNGRFDNEPPRGTSSLPCSAPSGGQTGNASQMAVRLPSRWPVVGVCLLLALAVWAVFGQTLHHEFVNYDDGDYVYENSTVTQGFNLSGIAWAFTHAHGGNWHPLTTLSHMLDCQLYGLKPGGHHLTNVLLQAATAIWLFLVLRNLTGAFWPSAFVAAVFAIHPLRVESVAWVSERKDVLSGLFFMLTIGAYARYARQAGGWSRKSQAGKVAHLPSLVSGLRSPAYWLALLLFTLGLMSKPMLVTVPFVLLLLDYWPLQRIIPEGQFATRDLRRLGRLFLEKAPFLLLAAADCVATILAQGSAIAPVEKLSLLARIGNALVAYAVYLGQAFYPAGLAVFYPHLGKHLTGWAAGLCGVVLIIITVGVLRWQRQKPYLLVGWLWYLGMLLPVIGLMQVGTQARADRYTYLPHIGLYIVIAWGLADLCGTWRDRRVLLPTAAVLTLTVLLVLARVQTTYWRDSVSLWSHALACTPENRLVHSNLGDALSHQGKLTEAIQHYERALQLQPDEFEIHNDLGVTLRKQGKLTEAMQHYERALQLKPDYAEAHNNFGNALAAQGKFTEAMAHFERALQLKPDYAEAHNNLGLALSTQGKLIEAIPHFERALQLNPTDAATHNNWGLALHKHGKMPEAIPHFEQALQLNPNLAGTEYLLGDALAAQGMLQEALPHFQRALNLATTQGNAALVQTILERLQAFPPVSSPNPPP